uniref:Dynein_C domain-containing protein n=1 Tax=Ascaris lumbricoides TaxID=6252 RepID=A0A0M3HLE0_ASCLU
MAWIHDFVERVNQLAKFAASTSLKKETVWLGGMFSPEAFITATRQLVAQSNQWSLEELNMRVEVGVTEDRVDSFKIQARAASEFGDHTGF